MPLLEIFREGVTVIATRRNDTEVLKTASEINKLGETKIAVNVTLLYISIFY